MKQTAAIASTPPAQITSGQEWRPASKDFPGVGRVRIVCRYPFATAQDGPIWIIEHLDSVQRLDRISEYTLTRLWILAADVPAH
jgi:hypothetical protein